MICHPTAKCDQVSDQYEEEVPSCRGYIWIFNTTEVPDSLKGSVKMANMRCLSLLL